MLSLPYRSAVALACTLAAAASAASAAPASAGTPVMRAAAATSFTASPRVIPAGGGPVRLQADLPGVARCRFSSTERFRLLPTTRRCTTTITVHVRPRLAAGPRRLVFYLRADGQLLRAVVRQSGVDVVTVRTAATAPLISTQPVGLVQEPLGQDATFSAAASGQPAPTAQWQVSTDSGSTWADVAAGSDVATAPTLTGTASSYAFVSAAADNENSYRVIFSNASGSATSESATFIVDSAPGPAAVVSTNWSGYAVSNGIYSSVSASWVVPTVSCAPGATTASAEWVGIDGWDSNTVEQDGTSAYCVGGTPVYFPWYEFWGDTALNNGLANNLPAANYPLASGDTVAVSTTWTAGSWLFVITDSTKGWTFTIPVPDLTPPAERTSAEWIVEDPQSCTAANVCSNSTLAAFAPVSFTSAVATMNGVSAPISTYSPTSLNMGASASAIEATTSPLNATGNSFTVTYTGP